MIRSDIIDIGSDLFRPNIIDISSLIELKPSGARAGPSPSKLALGLEQEVGFRQARLQPDRQERPHFCVRQGHLEQGRLEQALASREAEGRG